MREILPTVALLLILVSCTTEAVQSTETASENSAPEVQSEVSSLDEQHEVSETKKMDNGIVIKWFEHGSGNKLNKGECVEIDYKVQLEDGKIVDGNHLLKMESMPFIIGFGMQTPGWDIALQELQVGDFAEIFIPSNLARGEKGIKDLIPPNADNVLRIKIISRVKPTREVDGNRVWILEENPANKDRFGEGKEIEFHSIVSTESHPRYVNTFMDNKPFTMRLEDNGLVPGLKKALINAKKSDRMFILVPSSEAYGSKGYQDVVEPNEDILYNVLVMNVSAK